MQYFAQSVAAVMRLGPFVDDTDGKSLEEALTVANIDVQIIQPLDTAAIPPDRVANGVFASDTGWTNNSWTIAAGVADSAGAQSTTLSQTPATAFVENVAYEITFDVVAQSAGSVTPNIGGTAGTARSSVATFTETIIAGSGALLEFDAASFTGQIDNVVVKQVPIPITPAASGSTNDMVLVRANTGEYWLELTANQFGVLGKHRITAFISGALIVWKDFMVVPVADQMDANVQYWNDVVVATALETAADVADAVWDEAQADHVAGGSMGLLASEIASILADTGELQTDWVNGGRLDLLIDAIPTTAMRGTDSAALASEVTPARMATLTDWINGGRLDLLLDAVKAVTDQMVFTNANELDTNTKSINDAEVVGDGNATPWDGA